MNIFINKKSESEKIFEQIQKKYSITYYNASRFFPKNIRKEVRILYAFLRYPDEIVDNPEEGKSVEKIQEKLNHLLRNINYRWHTKNLQPDIKTLNKFILDKSIKTLKQYEDLILFYFINLAKENKFEYSWIEAFINPMRMDLTQNRYQTYEDLEKYIYGSAAVVGLMMNRIMRNKENNHLADLKSSDEAACTLGIAMQLTNFLRDIKEDFERGRIYFPLEDFKTFNLSQDEFLQAHNIKFLAFINFQISRTKRYYDHIFDNPHMIPKSSRFAVLTASYVYYDVLNRISKNPHKLWSYNFKKTFSSFPKAIISARLISS